MAKKSIAFGLILLLAVVTFDALGQKESLRTTNRRALVQAEHDFAKAAATKGTRAAFLEFLADDGIIFQPGPINGKEFWTERPARRGLLSWEPVFADVSRAFDLGYTTGPWEFRPNGPDDKPVAFGQYFTIWKKQSDGSWKAVLDRGVSSDKPFATKLLQFPRNDESSTIGASLDVAKGRALLLKLETSLSERAASKGALNAFDYYVSDDVRLLRQDMAPAVGKQPALEVVSAKLGTFSWTPVAEDMSTSGDLGYAYGTFEFSSHQAVVEHGSYVRVWKKQSNKWQVVIDVSSPDPSN